ncbi:hypothetical protein GPALN_005481 [Globodera pallida]|nr:hypothetical protein GPALN_005481 [Globodera pallida]
MAQSKVPATFRANLLSFSSAPGTIPWRHQMTPALPKLECSSPQQLIKKRPRDFGISSGDAASCLLVLPLPPGQNFPQGSIKTSSSNGADRPAAAYSPPPPEGELDWKKAKKELEWKVKVKVNKERKRKNRREEGGEEEEETNIKKEPNELWPAQQETKCKAANWPRSINKLVANQQKRMGFFSLYKCHKRASNVLTASTASGQQNTLNPSRRAVPVLGHAISLEERRTREGFGAIERKAAFLYQFLLGGESFLLSSAEAEQSQLTGREDFGAGKVKRVKGWQFLQKRAHFLINTNEPVLF